LFSRLSGGLVAAVATSAAVLCLGAPAARADYTVTFGSGQCGAFSSSATAGFSATPCASPALTISSGGVSNSGESEQFYKLSPPAGVSIVGSTPNFSVSSNTGTGNWGSGDFWQDSSGNYYGNSWNASGGTEASGTAESLPSSAYWAYQLTCGSTCSGDASVTLNSVALTLSESSVPQLGAPTGDANLFDATGGWVWNVPADPWPLTVSGSDPSGVCQFSFTAGAVSGQSPAQAQNGAQWQACPDWTWSGAVDTNAAQPKNGPMTVTIAGVDAAGNTNSASATIQVDDAPVTESLSTPNDATPGAWVNHAVTVDATPSAGKSGIASNQCTVDGATATAYPSGGLTVDGDGVHTVTCTAANNAVNPQGAHNQGSASEQIHIDEVAPSLGFEPVNPGNPRQLVVDSSDDESGVASTSVTMQGPHQATATTLPTTSSGGQTIATFPDAGKHGLFTFVATSCDNAGNCASIPEQLKLPIRLGARAVLSFNRIVPETTAKTKLRHITVDGHRRRITLVIKAGTRCVSRTIRTSPGHHRTLTACRARSPKIVTRRAFGYATRVKLHGVIETRQGAPVAGGRVVVSTRVDKRGSHFHTVLTSTTDTRGVWTAKLPKGPDRVVKAHYAGASDIEPATVTAHIVTRAGIATTVTPHALTWHGTMHVNGEMLSRRGLPRKGLALLLQVHYPNAKKWSTLLAGRTHKHGTFGFQWSYRSGRGTATYPFRVTLAVAQAGYPYAVGASRPVKVTFHP
jgi:hypothetical protein